MKALLGFDDDNDDYQSTNQSSLIKLKSSMAPSNKTRTWTEYYDQEGENIGMLRLVKNKELKHFDEMTLGLTDDAAALVGATSTYPYNWIILAGIASQGKVNILHHSFSVAETSLDDAKIVGVTGNRMTSALKSFDPTTATKSINPPRATARTVGKTIPSIQQFLSSKTPQEFQALTGGKDGEAKSNLSRFPNLFWTHQSVFGVLEGRANMKANEAAMQILNQITSTTHSDDETEDEEKDPDDVPATKTQKECYHLLTFLWAAANGYCLDVPLSDPPDTPIFHAKGEDIMEEIYGRVPGTAPPTDGGDGQAPNLTASLLPALVQNLTASTALFIKTADREAQKKSILSKLATDSATLFTVLSAANWNDTTPTLNRFTKQLVQDRDAASSINQVMSTTRSWDGLVSAKGLAKFLAVGYGAPDIDQQPGGFTIFMFWPRHVAGKRSSTTTTEQTIKSLFGDGKLSDEAVKHYAKSELYLTNDVELFDIQLRTCIDFLDLLTHSKGIACDGYRRGYSIFRGNKGRIRDLCRADKLFCMKFGYFLDRVFQAFIMDLMGHLGSTSPPIRAARRQLDGKQEEMVNDGLQGIAFGLVPQIHLPASLSEPTAVASSDDDVPPSSTTTKKKKKKKAGKPQDLDQRETRTTPHPNANPIKGWLIPTGKSYKDFFNPESGNTTDWPRFAHHKQKDRHCPICMKFQTVGSCVWGCNRSHLDPHKLDQSQRDEITSRLDKLYS
jgi:hypothetical protein